jgi:toxin-antitoxin system PIN domain toxin
MTSLDSNLLLYAYSSDSPFHGGALDFVKSLAEDHEVLLSEFSLVELYRLLRNPVVLKKPLSAPDAVEVIGSYRNHPSWRVAGFPRGDSAALHDELWRCAAQPSFAYRRIYDTRLALALRQHGVTRFATANVKDFREFGFEKVWNPLME